MKINIGNGMHLDVHRNQEYSEVAVDLVRNGRMTPLAVIGKTDDQDDLHVHVYEEGADEPIVHTFDPEACDFWTDPAKSSTDLSEYSTNQLLAELRQRGRI